MHNFFVTFIEVLRDRPPGHDWELEPGVTCGDYLFGMLQVSFLSLLSSCFAQASTESNEENSVLFNRDHINLRFPTSGFVIFFVASV